MSIAMHRKTMQFGGLLAVIVLASTLTGTAQMQGVSSTWILSRTALAGVTKNSQVAAGLASDPAYQVSNPSSTDTPVTSTTIVSYHTYGGAATVRLLEDHNALPAKTKAILLDQENWEGSCISSPADPCTPSTDLKNPVTYATEASQAVHAAGLTFVTAPAIDLFGSGQLPCSVKYWQCYLNYDMAGKMAAISDVIDIQAQSLGDTPATYQSFVDQAAAQARAANPKVVILAGLSTSDASASQMETDVADTSNVVSGYWMNVPDDNYTAAEQVMSAAGV